jgi:hypothetical protein
VRAVLEDVKIDRDNAGERRLTIEIAGRGVMGELVDEEGRPVDRAVITAKTAGDTYQRTVEGGTFKLLGLPAGTVTISAFTAERETAQPYPVSLGEESDQLAAVRLTLAPGTRLRGVIRSLDGPVIGARTWAPPSTLQSVIAAVPSDVRGEFDFALPPGMREVSFCVAAPGFAFRMLRLPVRSEPAQQVFVRQSGGALIVDSDIGADRNPYLVHEGVIIPAAAFAYLAAARIQEISDTRIRFEAPLVEEGAYSLCSFSEAQALAAETGAIAAGACVSTLVPTGSAGVLKREAVR